MTKTPLFLSSMWPMATSASTTDFT
jgi:hypothetical protein